MRAAAGSSRCGISGRNFSGMEAESSGLTSSIHLPETSVSWRADHPRALYGLLSSESSTRTTPLGSPVIWESSSRDIERPAPKRIASRRFSGGAQAFWASMGSDLGWRASVRAS